VFYKNRLQINVFCYIKIHNELIANLLTIIFRMDKDIKFCLITWAFRRALLNAPPYPPTLNCVEKKQEEHLLSFSILIPIAIVSPPCWKMQSSNTHGRLLIKWVFYDGLSLLHRPKFIACWVWVPKGEPETPFLVAIHWYNQLLPHELVMPRSALYRAS